MTPRDKGLLVEYVVRDLRGQERHGQLLTVKGTANGTRKNISNQCFLKINFRP